MVIPNSRPKKNTKRGQRVSKMSLINSILWLSVGTVIGWQASRMVEVEHKRTPKPVPNEDRSSEKG
jgi:hypothetical protein